MKIEGLITVTIVAKDFNKAVHFFSNVLEMDVKDFTNHPQSKKEGLKVAFIHGIQIFLVSPVYPLPHTAPAHTRRFAKLLEDKDALYAGVTFQVKNVEETATALNRNGIQIENRLDLPGRFGPLPVRDLHELVLDPEDTLGLQMAFVQFDREDS